MGDWDGAGRGGRRDTQDSENLVTQQLAHKCRYTRTADDRVSQEWTKDLSKGSSVLLWPDALEPENRSSREAEQ